MVGSKCFEWIIVIMENSNDNKQCIFFEEPGN